MVKKGFHGFSSWQHLLSQSVWAVPRLSPKPSLCFSRPYHPFSRLLPYFPYKICRSSRPFLQYYRSNPKNNPYTSQSSLPSYPADYYNYCTLRNTDSHPHFKLKTATTLIPITLLAHRSVQVPPSSSYALTCKPLLHLRSWHLVNMPASCCY
ncbi:LAFA_0E10484g1_1 [Lachancea sp. 'fantastica']|nr:LAFA_0E10484g1_1 [Lachancea sp. 'fantastica']